MAAHFAVVNDHIIFRDVEELGRVGGMILVDLRPPYGLVSEPCQSIEERGPQLALITQRCLYGAYIADAPSSHLTGAETSFRR